MSLQSTVTSASVNGWRGLSQDNPFKLNNVIVNNAPIYFAQGFGSMCAVSNNGEYFACSSASGSALPPYGDAYLWIFKNNFDGTYTQQASYTYPSQRVNSLSISDAGDYVAVTIATAQTPLSPLILYRRTGGGSTWGTVPVVTPPSFSFGQTSKISGDGNYVVVSGRNATGPQCVFMFARSGSSWNLVQTINLIPTSNTYSIGAVAINYDGSYVGVTYTSILGVRSLNIYYKASTTWVEQQKIVLPGGTGAGSSLSINNDATSLIVNFVSNVSTGSATIIDRIGTTWSINGQVFGPSLTDQFGVSVRIAGAVNTYVVSAPVTTVSGVTGAGVVYVFQKTNTGYSMIQRLYTNPISASARFTGASGLDIDTSGKWIIGGAPGIDSYGLDAGAAFLYTNA
jgi:hypothetical protein